MKSLAAFLFSLLCSVAQATPEIRVLLVFSPLARAALAAQHGPGEASSPSVAARDELDMLNSQYAASGIDVRFIRAGTVLTNDEGVTGSDYNAAAIEVVRGSQEIMNARNVTNADITLVFTENAGSTPGVAGVAGGLCASAAYAITIVKVSKLSYNTVGHEVGHLACAQHMADAVVRKSGNTEANCRIVASSMHQPVDRTITLLVWTAWEGNLSGPAGQIRGSGDDAEQANVAMAANCPAAAAQRPRHLATVRGWQSSWRANGSLRWPVAAPRTIWK